MKPTDEQIVKAATEAAKVYGPDENTHRHAFQLGYETAIKQMQDKWISVHDKSPELNALAHMEVLVLTSRGLCEIGVYFAGDTYCYELGDDVTHWMPLPEPPSQ